MSTKYVEIILICMSIIMFILFPGRRHNCDAVPASAFRSVTVPASAFRSGPFQTTITKANKCSRSTLPIDKNPPIFLDVEVYNTSLKNNLLRGNVTILTNSKNKKIKAMGFFWEQGKWKLVYLMNNMGCNSVCMPIVALFLGVKYDQKNCIYFKGKYLFEGVDGNKMQHTFASVQDYGRIKWRNEYLTQAGSAFCWEIETLVEPNGTDVKNV